MCKNTTPARDGTNFFLSFKFKACVMSEGEACNHSCLISDTLLLTSVIDEACVARQTVLIKMMGRNDEAGGKPVRKLLVT